MTIEQGKQGVKRGRDHDASSAYPSSKRRSESGLGYIPALEVLNIMPLSWSLDGPLHVRPRTDGDTEQTLEKIEVPESFKGSLPAIGYYKSIQIEENGTMVKKQVLAGFRGRDVTNEEAANILIGGQQADVFVPGNYGGGDNSVRNKYRPCFQLLPTPRPATELADQLDLLYVKVAAYIATLKILEIDDVILFINKWVHRLNSLQAAGYYVGMLKKALRHHIQICREQNYADFDELKLAISDAVEDNNLERAKSSLEKQIASLSQNLLEVERHIEKKAARPGYRGKYKGMSRDELKKVYNALRLKQAGLEEMIYL